MSSNPAARALLQRNVARYGFDVRKIDGEPQSFPARACIAFTLNLPKRSRPRN